MTTPPPPGFVRAVTFEEMTSAQRELYGPRRHSPLPRCDCEYNPLQKFDDEVPPWHREKP
jgi:hypothetical protein